MGLPTFSAFPRWFRALQNSASRRLHALLPVLRWLQDTLPRRLGLRVVADLLAGRAGFTEFKLPMRGYSQLDSYSCGVAAGWSVLRYFRPEADFQTFDTDCAPDPDWGTSTRRLAAALRGRDLRVVQLRDLDFAALRLLLKSGFPVLTTVREWHWQEHTHHWVVIYGYGWKPNRIHLIGRTGAPGFSKRELPWQEFKSIWSGRDDSLVCFPRELGSRKKRKTTHRKSATA